MRNAGMNDQPELLPPNPGSNTIEVELSPNDYLALVGSHEWRFLIIEPLKRGGYYVKAERIKASENSSGTDCPHTESRPAVNLPYRDD